MPKTMPRRVRTRTLATNREHDLIRATVTVQSGQPARLRIADGPLHSVLEILVDGAPVARVEVGADGSAAVDLPDAGNGVDVCERGRLLVSGQIPGWMH